ncbi:arginase family protein [Thorsellia anophelis]|uniref:Formimidoylglutamase n=1 Tax=Thorsellia anophelis DSM 18579 TaxID=1123402 RepID=A0A1I0C470_9GAMM|nr:arginase family protein [Thorsellia anophelis]SET13881.1 formiminoglutamase [Thorsellia anophelis DSM 18579]
MTFKWQGRQDGEGKFHHRWHNQIVELDTSNNLSELGNAVVLLGVESDEGVRRNKGRVGAAKGPKAIRQQLANVALHDCYTLYDAGDIGGDAASLEKIQIEQTERISQIIQAHGFVIVLGGGHEIAFGSFMGMYYGLMHRLNEIPRTKQVSLEIQDQSTLPLINKNPIISQNMIKVGILNFDAHFDLRQQPIATSGSPFFQIAKQLDIDNVDFNYACIGINENSNTAILFETARQLDVSYLFDNELQVLDKKWLAKWLDDFLNRFEHLYISIDLDVFSYTQAPGVSAPAVCGVPLYVIEWILGYLFSSGKVRIADIAELNPNFDIDNHTSKLAAYLVTVLTKLKYKSNA